MDLIQISAAVIFGNLMTLILVWGMWLFNKHDSRAPLHAYGAVLFPIVFFLAIFATAGHLPPQLDALAPLLSGD
jgi:hypothetical protein